MEVYKYSIHKVVGVYQKLVCIYQNHVGVHVSIRVSYFLLSNQITVFITTMI